MKTSRLLIITAATIALAAPTASARPVVDPPARPHKAQASNMATIAAHKEQLSTEQYLASRGAGPEAQPLTDRTAPASDRFPIVFVLFGIAIPLALVAAKFASKPVRAYAHSRRSPARVA